MNTLETLVEHLLNFFFLYREQEKELLIRKKGKRPRGRPRKILVSANQNRKGIFQNLVHSFLIFSLIFRKMCLRSKSPAALHLAPRHHPLIRHPPAPLLHPHQTTMTTTATSNRPRRAPERVTFIPSRRRRRRLSWQNRSPQRNGAGNLCPPT